MLAPADGKVSVVREEDGRLRVGVFMNVTDVHVNRAPLAGTVREVTHSPGANRPAFSKESDRNENVEIDCGAFSIVQIAGAFARRIHPSVESGDEIARGEQDWIPLLRRFWEPLKKRIEDKEANVTRAEAVQARELGTDPKSGRPVSARMGRYGPIVQIGTRDDEEKPRFAALRPGQKLDTITLEEALPLFDLPRDLGTTEDGEEMQANIGRFGPYVRFGDRFASLRGDDDPYTVTPERARELVREKKIADANRIINRFETEDGTVIQVLNGRYGPYITNGRKNAKVPKDAEPAELTRTRCEELLAAAPERGRGKKKAAAKKQAGKKTAAKKKSTARKKRASTKKRASKKKAAAKKSASTGALANAARKRAGGGG